MVMNTVSTSDKEGHTRRNGDDHIVKRDILVLPTVRMKMGAK